MYSHDTHLGGLALLEISQAFFKERNVDRVGVVWVSALRAMMDWDVRVARRTEVEVAFEGKIDLFLRVLAVKGVLRENKDGGNVVESREDGAGDRRLIISCCRVLGYIRLCPVHHALELYKLLMTHNPDPLTRITCFAHSVRPCDGYSAALTLPEALPPAMPIT
jgi:hypothetical protein